MNESDMPESSAVPGCTCEDEHLCDACFEYERRRYAYLARVPVAFAPVSEPRREELMNIMGGES